ncbi:MAG: hypothetical protein EAX81_05670 [Candidatus Thorarchaeota archaeon]|nr:hypothetical protein [Candidatus Thorarchaeota archaeon]
MISYASGIEPVYYERNLTNSWKTILFSSPSIRIIRKENTFSRWMVNIMGLKAEGAAQGFTVLGGLVLTVIGLQMLVGGINTFLGGSVNALIDVLIAIALLLMVALSYDACGFINWKVRKSGGLLAIFGLSSIFIVLRNVSFDLVSWLLNAGTLAGFMILIAGILLVARS